MGLTPDESWPKMEHQLDRYYAGKRRKRAALFLLSLAVIGMLIGNWYGQNAPEPVTANVSTQTVTPKENSAVSGSSLEASDGLSSKSASTVVPVEPKRSVPTVTAGKDSKAPVATMYNRPVNEDRTAAVPAEKATRITTASRTIHSSSMKSVHSQADMPISTPVAKEDLLPSTSQVPAVQDRSAAEQDTDAESERIVTEWNGQVEGQKSTGDVTVDAPAMIGTAPVSGTGITSAVNTQSEKDAAVAPPIAVTVTAEKSAVQDSSRVPAVSGITSSIEVSYGRYVRSRTLSASDAQWNQRRIDEEELLIPQSFSVLYTRTKGNGSISMGLEFLKLGESTYYNGSTPFDSILDNSYYSYVVDSLDTLYLSGNQLILRDGTPDVLDSIYNQILDTVSGNFIDPSLVTRNETVTWSLVQIPIRFGYSVSSGKLAFTGQVSLSPGLLTGVKGRYLDRSMSQLVDAGSLATVRRFQLAASFGLRMEYRLGSAWSIMVGPDWRRQFTSMYKKGSGVDQRYSPWGVSAGVRLRLGSR
ncbi:MAG: hypothetical protein RL021_2119 [Bacteroidota bacterium]